MSMTKSVRMLALALAGALAVGTAQPAAAQDGELARIVSNKTVRVGAIEAYPYYRKDLKSGEWTGMMPEIFDTLFGSIGVKVEYVTTTWGTAAAGLQANQFDVVGGLNATPMRALALSFSVPIAQSKLSVMTLGDDSSGFTTWAGLNSPDVKIAAVDGASTTRLGQKLAPDATWTLVKSTDAMILELESGRVDVILSNAPTLSQYKQAKGAGTLVIPEPVRAQNVNIGLRQNADDLKAWLDVAVDYFTAIGDIPTIWDKYVPVED
ncbi:transporter substrate-binding domain-containing protein [Acuticoccus mangrovi]|uniref:Transporter substrate-binding domain-containing protein n=1 Tax=Acuticoccus mangrovi TaxID=2796142 RepID=A0A934IHH4_9HYPH|nr:transporter substrate-binding domain-containing protein [Acuticoccus mangrovi]MBJ3776553.1 transporter substrate-binding domain-containing protein [Acuticoccus mangrovi]